MATRKSGSAAVRRSGSPPRPHPEPPHRRTAAEPHYRGVFPNSRKVYLDGPPPSPHGIRVPLREISLSGGEPPLLTLMEIAVSRNAYGRQRESFEAMVESPAIDLRPFRVAFIRAPVVTRVGEGVQVLAVHAADPVLLQQGRLLASSFHPEITGYDGIHRYFCALAASAREVA